MKRVGIVVGLVLFCVGTAFADFKSGLNAYNNKDYASAVVQWKSEAAKGDLNSQYNLGLLFETGVEGIAKDLAVSYGWYRLAASQNVAAAQQAIDRIKPLMTAGQIEDGNKQAIELYGKWFRKNIGRNEQEYQAAKLSLEKERKAKIELERQAAAERAQRQRDLIAQRDADAKLANSLEKESRAAAIKAAQEKAEEAKRNALIAQRRKEEEERLAALKQEQERKAKLSTARNRLAELQAKQKGGQSGQAIIVAVPKNTTTKAVSQTATRTNAQTTVKTYTQPTSKVVASLPQVPTKTTLPSVSDGLDAGVVKQIVERANATPLDTALAQQEIKSGRGDIEALKWSLISAARGKASAKRMNTILVKSMTEAQISEANKRAAEWINKRQSRQ